MLKKIDISNILFNPYNNNKLSAVMHYLTSIFYIVTHFIASLPGLCWYGPQQLYNRVGNRPITHIVGTTDPESKIVVFVHGFNGKPQNFIPLINNLKILGATYSTATVDLGPTHNSSIISDSDVLDKFLKKYSGREICLVGLSKGGLVVSNYVATYHNHSVSKVITIASPLRGTAMADFLPSGHISRIEFGSDSKFTQDLAKNLPANVKFYHIVPEWDHLIIPTSNSYYENCQTKICGGHTSHVGIVFDMDVAQTINTWINE